MSRVKIKSLLPACVTLSSPSLHPQSLGTPHGIHHPSSINELFSQEDFHGFTD
jgi:hypothetical protein